MKKIMDKAILTSAFILGGMAITGKSKAAITADDVKAKGMCKDECKQHPKTCMDSCGMNCAANNERVCFRHGHKVS